MGKRRAREIWEYDSMAEFEADGGAAGYGSGAVKIAGKFFSCHGGKMHPIDYDNKTSARKTVALLGDSYIVRDTQVNNGTGYQQISIKSIFEWINIRLNKRLDPIYFDGLNGSTVTSFLTRIDAAIAAGADYIYIQGSVNNFGTSPVSLADQKAGYAAIINKVIAAGQTPIITTVPCSVNCSTSAEYQDWIDFNNWLRLTGREFGSIVCDYANGIVDPDSRTGQPVSAYTDTGDGVHRGSNGAIIDSYYAAESLKNHIPEYQIPWVEIYDAAAMGKRINCIKNPTMAGSGGTAGVGASGVIAADWQLTTYAGSTAVGSKVARTDGAAGFWQQIVYTPGSAENNTCSFYSNNTSLGDKVAGDNIEVFAEFELDYANIEMLKGIQFRIYFIGATTERSYEFVDYGTNALATEGGVIKGVLSTPKRSIPAGATGINISFDMIQKSTGSPVTARIGRVCID